MLVHGQLTTPIATAGPVEVKRPVKPCEERHGCGSGHIRKDNEDAHIAGIVGKPKTREPSFDIPEASI